MSRRFIFELEAEASESLLAQAARRQLTVQELVEKILIEAMASNLLPAILGEEDEAVA